MQQIAVQLGDNSYDVRIEHGLLQHSGAVLAPFARGGRLLLVTDSTRMIH